jgi:Tfp pilus assembly protein PilV
MRNNRSEAGFTLIEAMTAMVVMLFGIVAVAHLFSYSAATNITTQQISTANLLATNKLEELRAVPVDGLTAGGSLDPDSPTTNFWDYVSIAQDGTITADTSTTSAPYLRLWTITGTSLKELDVVVYSQRSSLGRAQMELARAPTTITR